MKFRVCPHGVLPGQEMVEVFTDAGLFIAAIYPNEAGLHVVSKYAVGAEPTAGLPQGVLVRLGLPPEAGR